MALVVLVCSCSHQSASTPESTQTEPPATGTTSPPSTTTAPPATTMAPSTSTVPPAKPKVRVPRPPIVWRPIPFGATRRAETAAYAERHYGIDTWRLRHPHVIVEHYTAASTFASAYYTFASDAPDSELHELPGTCAHFVIDTDGTIYQLVHWTRSAATPSGSTGPRSGSSTWAPATPRSSTIPASCGRACCSPRG